MGGFVIRISFYHRYQFRFRIQGKHGQMNRFAVRIGFTSADFHRYAVLAVSYTHLIIQCAAMSAVASKERKESRWGLWHMRSDYPVKDDAQWLKHIVLTQGDSLEDIRVSYAPVIKMEETA